MSEAFMNYATSLNSVSSASASSITSANSSYVNPHTSLQNHTPPNTSLTEPSPTSPASMAAAMFYQQQQAADNQKYSMRQPHYVEAA